MTKNKLFLLYITLIAFASWIPRPVRAVENYSEWITNTPLPYNAAGNQSLLFGQKIYNFGGGDNFTYHPEILTSDINVDGSNSAWVSNGQLPATLTWYSVANRGNDIFLIGGAKPDPTIPIVSSVNSVYSSKIDSSGNISDWIPLIQLPQKLARGAAFVYLDRIYFVGGLVHTTNSAENIVNTVYFANILSDGTIGNWIQTSSLPQGRAEFALFNKGNAVFVIGGMQSNAQPANTIYKGIIDEITGQIVWNLDSNIPVGLRRPAYTLRGNTAYLLGGYDGSNFTTNSYYSTYNNDAFTDWKVLNIVLPMGSCCNAAVSTEKNIYLIGGHDGVSYFPNVLRSEISSSIPVPDLKQHSQPWADVEYDTAHMWSPGKETISRYGCALTSATMILQHYGHTITPDALNTWLLNNNGYVREGLLDWSAVTKWVKLSHDINPLLPKLEYGRKNFTTDDLNTEIDAERPTAIKLARADGGTHFVVAKGRENNDYDINDPATTQTLLSFYPPTQYSRIDTLTPSNTDLSYLYFYTGDNVQFTVTAPNGQKLLNNFYKEGPYIDQTSKLISPQHTLHTFALQKPQSGEYLIRVKGKGNYFTETRIYNTEGDMNKSTSDSDIQTGKTHTYVVIVSDSAYSKKIDFEFIRQSLKDAYQTGLIKNKFVYNSLSLILSTADKVSSKDKGRQSVKILEAMKIEIRIAKKQINSEYATKLSSYIKYLQESL